jgi:ribulose-phosphate 3-epimerase
MSFWSRHPQDRLLADYSLWSGKLENLSQSIRETEEYADLYHFDVADAHFVPGLLFFPDLVAALRPLTDTPFHVHLMTDAPEQTAPPFMEAGADLITLHVENSSAGHAIQMIREGGCAVGVALQLETPLSELEPFLDTVDLVLMMGTRLGIKGAGLAEEALPRIRSVRQLLEDRGRSEAVKLSADGGIRSHTVPSIREAGADMITPGSLVFKSSDLAETTRWLHALPGSQGAA